MVALSALRQINLCKLNLRDTNNDFEDVHEWSSESVKHLIKLPIVFAQRNKRAELVVCVTRADARSCSWSYRYNA